MPINNPAHPLGPGGAILIEDIPFSGVMIEISAPIEIAHNTVTQIDYDTIMYQDKYKGHSLWLGADLAFTTDFATNTEQATATAHGMITGDGPFFLTTSTADLPNGLATATKYWAVRINDNTIEFAISFANALVGTTVSFSDDGTGTHTLDRAARIIVPDGVTKMSLWGTGSWAIDATGTRQLRFYQNDVTFDNAAFQSTSPSAFNAHQHHMLPVALCVGGDYFSIRHFQNSGSPLNLTGSIFAAEIVGAG